MASEEHKQLAALIKETHNRLREDYRKYGSNEAWKRHLARTDDLQVRFKNFICCYFYLKLIILKLADICQIFRFL